MAWASVYVLVTFWLGGNKSNAKKMCRYKKVLFKKYNAHFYFKTLKNVVFFKKWWTETQIEARVDQTLKY